MNNIVLERHVLERLSGLREQAEICDETGRVYGVFSPAKQMPRQIRSPYSDEELDRIAAQSGGRQLSEILADLRARS